VTYNDRRYLEKPNIALAFVSQKYYAVAVSSLPLASANGTKKQYIFWLKPNSACQLFG